MKVSSPSSPLPSPVADSAAGAPKADKTRQPVPRSPGRKGDAALTPLSPRRASTGTQAADADANVEAPRGSVAPNVRPRRAVDAAAAQPPLLRAPAKINQEIASRRLDPQSGAQLPAAPPTIGRGLRPLVLPDDFARHAGSVDSLKQFQQLVRAIASQPASSRAAPLSVLLQRIGFLPPADISTAFNAALGAIRTLDVAHQGEPLAALASNLGAVPALERHVAIAALLHAVAS